MGEINNLDEERALRRRSVTAFDERYALAKIEAGRVRPDYGLAIYARSGARQMRVYEAVPAGSLVRFTMPFRAEAFIGGEWRTVWSDPPAWSADLARRLDEFERRYRK